MAEEQSPETKTEARAFMSDLLTGPPAETFAGGEGVDMAAWKSTYNAANNKDETLMEQFWSIYDPSSTSIWTMAYDEADSNENLDDTINIAKEFITKTESLKDHCFGIIHTLESLEIEGLWFFNGPDPERLFGANEETSWYNWSQVGPEANDLVKTAVASVMAPEGGKLNGKAIKHTHVFS
mmetsp:Transcript_12125/g.14637  ORF Transcript_12125/g.14637 Transcript_12125/m.14637 type:complete len:181 (+) Transcript_12125:38-580(+)|eukprot:CAMPEP_0195302810 /NCGR_PEP_ID=MMETSP0707-20130614/31722_1 /TAXON_ID=33640 /ORGANISM="Asterionellopsis glacialis, Strain CCMP134" /LENGTH=180 /DNA_ID=CAMNT_0040366163 /DNA_START=15 /DNA_END=557 /DNA_ORIENTATION=+